MLRELKQVCEITDKNLLAQPEAVLFKRGLEHLQKHLGVVIRPDPGAATTCYLSLYTKTKPLPVVGVNWPSDFEYYRPLNPEEFLELNRRWRETLLKDLDPETASFWLPVLAQAGKTQIEGFVKKLLSVQSEHTNHLENLTGFDSDVSLFPDQLPTGVYPRAFVPAASWFAPTVAELKPEQILTLFPPVERDLFLLFLGRVLVGRDSTITLEGERVDHKFRKLAILYGKDPRTGKSTLCNAITDALRLTGYRVSTFRGLGEKFNMGQVYLSDLAFRDDVTVQAAEKILASDDTKTLVTGGQLWVENKGQDGYTVYPRCGVLFCTNHLDQTLLFKKDAGILDRLLILYTYSQAELSNLPRPEGFADSPDLRSWEHLRFVARRAGCEVPALILWIFRLAVDRFLEEHHAGTLEETVSVATTKLTFPISSQALPNVVAAMHLAILLRQEKPRVLPLSNKATLLFAFKALAWLQGDPRAQPVRHLVEQDWETKNRPALHPHLALRSLNTATLLPAIDALQLALSQTDVGLDDALKTGFSQLSTLSGISVGSGKFYVRSAWDEFATGSPGVLLLQDAARIKEEILTDPRLEQTVQSLTQPAHLVHTNSVGFDQERLNRHLNQYLQSRGPVDFLELTRDFLEG